MCGACGVRPDWAGPVVAGPLRRRDIARCLTGLCRHVTVRDMPRGWVVAGSTGRVTPAQTLAALTAAAAPHARARTWAELEQLLLGIPAPMRTDTWGSGQLLLPQPPAGSALVLAAVTHLPAHMKLAAFALGVSSIPSPKLVSADLCGVQLAAREGHLLGMVPG